MTPLPTHARRTRTRIARLAIVMVPALLAAGGLILTAVRAPAAPTGGTITGLAFQDFNSNGVRDAGSTIPNDGSGTVGVAADIGVANITVTAYDQNGNVAGTTTTGANGTYSLVVGGSGPYRVEFTNLPAGYQPGPYGPPNNNTTVQFVDDPLGGTLLNVDVALTFPADYCQNNPELVTACYVFGDQFTPPYGNMPVLVSFPYSAGSNRLPTTPPLPDYDNPTTHALMVPANQVGTAYGLAVQATTGRLFAAAFMKRHTGFGPGGIDAIYAITPTTGTAFVYADFDTLLGTPNSTGPDLHDTTNYLRDYLTAAPPVANTWDAVGKTGFGAMTISDDETRLYVINLFDRRLYSLPANTTPTPANILSQSVPLNPPACPSPDDVRPFAVKFYRGLVYVGMVCSAESTQDQSNLFAYVYTADPTTLAFSAAPVFSMPLNYTRGATDRFSIIIPAEWLPWSPAFNNIDPTDNLIYPQPILSDIAFDNGNLILGFRDRAGDQGGGGTESNPTNMLLYNTITAGDILRACGNPTIGWTLENNARCGGLGNGPQGNGEGPGSGEYYFRDELVQYHDELSMGGAGQIPGFPDVVALVFDPIPRTPAETAQLFDGGFRWLNNSTGEFSKAYRLYNGDYLGQPGQPFFGKANGLGELVPLCAAAPIEIGNRVWLDQNQNGIQDAQTVTGVITPELPIPGVTVNLYDPLGVVIATAVTDANGNYYFSNAAGTSTSSAIYNITGLRFSTAGYSIRLDNPANYGPGGPLEPHTLTFANNDPSPNGDIRDSDGTLPAPASPIGPGNYPQVPLNIGAAGFNNHTYDFGFFNIPTAVELIDFHVEAVVDKQVNLVWTTATEVDNFGFNLYRARSNDFSRAAWVHFEPSSVGGSGSGATYRYADTVPDDGLWWYWLADVDTHGRETRHSPIVAVVGADALLPHRVYLPVITHD
jgi:hypothetical protein